MTLSFRSGRVLLLTVLVALTTMTVAPPAVTQPSEQSGERRQARKRVAKLRTRVLRNKVGLSDAKIERVVAILERQQAQRHSLEKQLRQSRRALGQLFKADSSDQAAYAQHLDALQEAQRSLATLRDEQITDLREVLEPKEQAKLFRAMEMVKRRLEKRRANRRGR